MSVLDTTDVKLPLWLMPTQSSGVKPTRRAYQCTFAVAHSRACILLKSSILQGTNRLGAQSQDLIGSPADH